MQALVKHDETLRYSTFFYSGMGPSLGTWAPTPYRGPEGTQTVQEEQSGLLYLEALLKLLGPFGPYPPGRIPEKKKSSSTKTISKKTKTNLTIHHLYSLLKSGV